MSTDTAGPRKGPEPPDLSERGGMRAGQPQRSDERLFMQLLAYGGCRDTAPLARALDVPGVEGVLYADANDPQGVAILTVTRDPNFFVETLRPILNGSAFADLSPKPELTMLGRTYAIGTSRTSLRRSSTGPAARCSTRRGRGLYGTRCGGAASSRCSHRKNSA